MGSSEGFHVLKLVVPSLPGSKPGPGRACAGAVSLVAVQEDLKRRLRSQDVSEDAVAAFLVQKTPVLTDALWKQNVVDIEATVTAVVAAVLQEPGVPRDVLQQRAKALKKLGVIFQVRHRTLRHSRSSGGALDKYERHDADAFSSCRNAV